MADGSLPIDCVDVTALPFGDEPTWAGTAAHARIVREIINEAYASGRIASGRSPVGAAGLAKQAVLDKIVTEMNLVEAAHRQGRGSTTEDVTFRELRARIDDHVEHLFELTEYHRLTDDVRDQYALRAEGDLDRSKVSSRRRTEFEKASTWLAELQNSISGVPGSSGSPQAARSRRNPFLDNLGRGRWPVGGGRLRARPSTDYRDRSTILARLGLPINEKQRLALPSDWKTVPLSAIRIAQAWTYPRPIHLNEALKAIDHAPFSGHDLSPRLIAVMDRNARPYRQALLASVNGLDAVRQLGDSVVSDRWWRALAFYQQARWLAGEDRAGPVWPKPWDYLCAARPEVYSERGLLAVRQLDAICGVGSAMSASAPAHWQAVLKELQHRSPAYSTMVYIALRQSGPQDLTRAIATIWADGLAADDVDELLPGFAG